MTYQDTKKSKGLKQKIYEDLKDKLIRCVFEPGSELNEMQLSEEYGVSRTPIREAISQLEVEGYVKVLPKKGIYISDITVDNVLQIFQTRIEIEPVTLTLAYPYLNVLDLIEYRHRFEEPEVDIEDSTELDMEMHLFLIDQCRNQYLITMMHKLFNDNTRMLIATGQDKVKIHKAREEHLEILDSLIEHQDPDVCAELMRRHLKTCRTAALKYFSSEEYLKHLEGTADSLGNRNPGEII
ncbi:MAG: GntR family transcriptional regulator [Lachnospiraceae bacterium]|nr:GntR family transcriptional regulator [Lachnospiraceae bacterium]